MNHIHSCTHTHTRARTKLAGGWLGWIHNEVQAINFIWVSQTLQYHFLKHLYAHRLTWRQTDAHSRRHTLTFTFRIPWWNISHLFLQLAYQPNLSVPTSILLIYSEWFEVAVIRCGFSYVRIVYIMCNRIDPIDILSVAFFGSRSLSLALGVSLAMFQSKNYLESLVNLSCCLQNGQWENGGKYIFKMRKHEHS